MHVVRIYSTVHHHCLRDAEGVVLHENSCGSLRVRRTVAAARTCMHARNDDDDAAGMPRRGPHVAACDRRRYGQILLVSPAGWNIFVFVFTPFVNLFIFYIFFVYIHQLL